MGEDKLVGYVFETSDYDKFKRLQGNREVLKTRISRILKSIKKIGYIGSPITVNEKLEVIDGQGRLEACKMLNIPVCYQIIDGIGINECIEMNKNQVNWSIPDYISSYAENGNESYVLLTKLMQEYGNIYKLSVIACALAGTVHIQTATIKNGNFKCDKESYSRAVDVLDWMKDFVPIIERVKGHSEYYYVAIMYCYFDTEVNNKRLLRKMEQLQASLIPVTTQYQAFDIIEEIYNRSIKRYVYIKTNYKKALQSKHYWYANKWGK